MHRRGLLLQMSHVAWSVCRCVDHTDMTSKNDRTDWNAVWEAELADLGWSKEPRTRWGSTSDESIHRCEGWQDDSAVFRHSSTTTDKRTNKSPASALVQNIVVVTSTKNTLNAVTRSLSEVSYTTWPPCKQCSRIRILRFFFRFKNAFLTFLTCEKVISISLVLNHSKWFHSFAEWSER